MCEDISAHGKVHFGRPAVRCQTTYGHFSKILAKFVGMQPTNISKIFHPVNDDLGINTLGAYSIPCECGQVYVGQTGHTIETRVEENYRHNRLGQPDRWAVPEHRFNNDHRIQIQNNQKSISNPAIMTGYQAGD